jgi:hypothetical protein
MDYFIEVDPNSGDEIRRAGVRYKNNGHQKVSFTLRLHEAIAKDHHGVPTWRIGPDGKRERNGWAPPDDRKFVVEPGEEVVIPRDHVHGLHQYICNNPACSQRPRDCRDVGHWEDWQCVGGLAPSLTRVTVEGVPLPIKTHPTLEPQQAPPVSIGDLDALHERLAARRPVAP